MGTKLALGTFKEPQAKKKVAPVHVNSTYISLIFHYNTIVDALFVSDSAFKKALKNIK